MFAFFVLLDFDSRVKGLMNHSKTLNMNEWFTGSLTAFLYFYTRALFNLIATFMSPCAEQISRLLRDSLHPHGCEGSALGDTGRAKAELGYKQEVSNGCQVWSWWEKKLFLNLQVDLIKVGVPVTTREVKGSNLENRLRLEQQLKREECVSW